MVGHTKRICPFLPAGSGQSHAVGWGGFPGLAGLPALSVDTAMRFEPSFGIPSRCLLRSVTRQRLGCMLERMSAFPGWQSNEHRLCFESFRADSGMQLLQ
jgi:hypothetical protein